MKKILFIPTYTYLSSPIFTNLLPELKEYETIYLDIEDQYQCEKTSVEFKKQFTKSINLHMNATGATFVDKVIKLFKMIKYQKQLINIIKKESPVAIITTSDLTFSYRIVSNNFTNISIFIIQSALFVDEGIPRKKFQKLLYIIFNTFFKIPLISKQNYFGREDSDANILLWGKYFQKFLLPNRNSYIVGDITLDFFPIQPNIQRKKDLFKNMNIPLSTKIVTICTSVLDDLVEPETIEHMHNIYKTLITTRSDLFFIVKPHPRNNTKELSEVFTSLSVTNCIVVDTYMHELFEYTDIHISSFSRTATEAIASNIPIITVNPNNEIKLLDILNNELNEKVTNSSEMLDKIEDILVNRELYLSLRDKYIEDKLYKIDGKASKRTADIIKKGIGL